MGLRKDVKEIKDTLNQVTKTALTKANLYEKQLELLSKIKIEVKKVSTVLNPNLTTGIKVEYYIPPIQINIDSEGNVENNEMFKAINLLDLISFEDMGKISSEIAKAKKQFE